MRIERSGLRAVEWRRSAGVCLLAAALAAAPACLWPALAGDVVRGPEPTRTSAATGEPAAAREALGARDPGADPLAAIPAPAGAADGEVVVAYYCHVTFRCETCLTAERLISDLLQADFAGQLERRSLVWHPLDYEQPENASYARAFGLEGGPAFILGRWRGARLVEWHEITEIWDHSDDPIGLVDLTRERVKLFLQAEKWRAVMDSTRAANAPPSTPSSPGSGAATDTQKGR